ncbi:hypothetical protein T484DRAFT_1832730, partial [Baffinella frigidus]
VCQRAFDICDYRTSAPLEDSDSEARPSCVTPQLFAVHTTLCALSNCSSAECGSFLACRHSGGFEEANLSCTDGYRATARKGEEFCIDSRYGGKVGCVYDSGSGACGAIPDCTCYTSHAACLADATCDTPSNLAPVQASCLASGCPAFACSSMTPQIDGQTDGQITASCDASTLLCANDYLSCALGPPFFSHESPPSPFAIASPEGGGAWCAASACLSRYFHCMDEAACVSGEDRARHALMCEQAGCTLEQCGIVFTPEERAPPDAPTGLLERAPPDAPTGLLVLSRAGPKLEGSWSHSPLAVAWARFGSVNAVLDYTSTISGDCDFTTLACNSLLLTFARTGFASISGDCDFTTLACSSLLLTSLSPFAAPRLLAHSSGLITIGQLYRFSVQASNLAGIGPPAHLLHRAAGPPEAPEGLGAVRSGALGVRFSWNLPTNTGDTTQVFFFFFLITLERFAGI